MNDELMLVAPTLPLPLGGEVDERSSSGEGDTSDA